MAVEQPPFTTQPGETHPVHAAIERPPELPPAPTGRAKMLVGAVLLVLLTAGLVTFLTRKGETDALAKETDAAAIPTVAVVQPATEAGNDELVLPGNLQAFEESPIFARTNGYLVRWYKDMGSKVEKGELLASIDTPEVDQELSQARAAREQIKAALGLAKISADRWANLRKTDSVSQQEADQQASGYTQAQANLAAADANVRRLEEMESFKNVYAPFSGVLTRRNVDPGALINSGAQAAGKELFDIARVDPLRVYVSVPQAYAPSMKVGVKAAVTLQEFPGQKFTGTVVRTADAIDMSTRTLNTEVDVPNKDGKAAARVVWAGTFRGGKFGAANHDPGECDVVPRGGSAGRGGRARQQGAIAADRDRARLRQRRLKFWAGWSRATGSLLILRTRWRTGSRCRLPLPRLRLAREPATRDGCGIKCAHFCPRSLLIRCTHADRSVRATRASSLLCLILITLFCGCAVGPNYKRPAAAVPDTWKGEGPWQTAAPKDGIPKGNWWEIYHDCGIGPVRA